MRVLILSRGSQLYSTQRLIGAFRKKRMSTQIVDPLECNLLFDGQEAQVLWHGKPLVKPAVVVPRIGASVTEYGLAVLNQFTLQDIPVINAAFQRARDKLRALQILTRNGIPIPKTLMTRDPAGIDKMIQRIGGAPVVLKLLQGTQGVGVMLAESSQAAESVLDTLWSLGQNILIQQFVSESRGRDIRAIVVGTEVVAAMRRRAKRGEFRSNIHRGGRGEAVQRLKPEYRNAAVSATQALGLHIAGVDMLETREGPAVMEVNPTPGLEGIERTTGVDIAGAIAEFTNRYVQTWSRSARV